MVSLDAVDSALMLRVAPAKSAFSTDWKTTVMTVSLAEASTVVSAQSLIKISCRKYASVLWQRQ